jgi:crotonobetainyl-CoA:carnitine CoA-transferase CaiB-like acyl-CoA transferase
VLLELGEGQGIAYAGLLAALAGATVLKVEPPDGASRLATLRNDATRIEFDLLNANKSSVTINLRAANGRELFLELVGRADVVCSDLGEEMEALGLSGAALRTRNPSLVCASLTAAGCSGEPCDAPATELAVQALVGVMSVTGYPHSPPVQAGPAVASCFGGAHLYAGVVGGLFRRERTGVGCLIDIAMMDALYPALMSNIGRVIGGPFDAVPREGNRNGGQATAPYNMYETSSGYVALRVTSDEHWQALEKLFEGDGVHVPAALDSMAQRLAQVDLVDEIVGTWTRQRTTEEACAAAGAAGVPCGPVRTVSDVLTDPVLRDRGVLVDRSQAANSTPVGLHTPLCFHGEQRVPLHHAPVLGEDSALVFQEWLGLSAQRLAALRAEGVI